MSESANPFSANLYVGKSTLFKSFLLIGVAAISAFFIWYSFGLIDQLKEDTRAQVEKYAKLFQIAINSPNTGAEMQFIFDEIIIKANFPIIVLDTRGNPIQWRNIPDIEDLDTSAVTLLRLKSMSQEMQDENHVFPIYYGTQKINYLCYGDPAIINELQKMPFIEIGVVFAFMLAGIVGFQNIKKSEERLIWVGMAKETAHQLGTPISSLLGWLELLNKENRGGLSDAELEQLLERTVENMQVDVERLQKVANRFGQIGSIPALMRTDLNRLITETVEYYRRRLPFEGKGTRLEFVPGQIEPVRVNAELFSWVLENLVKNGLQAVSAKTGLVAISTSLSDDGKSVQVYIADNGSGIPAGMARKIFRAGFTTKKRGWGMGLTLVKRIVEEYHGGSVSLKRSHPGETVFEILLPTSTTLKET